MIISSFKGMLIVGTDLIDLSMAKVWLSSELFLCLPLFAGGIPSHELLKRACDANPDIIIAVDREGTILECNKGDVLGLNNKTRLITDLQLPGIPRLLNTIKRSIDRQREFSYELDDIAGGRFSEIRVYPLEQAVAIVQIRDIAAKRLFGTTDNDASMEYFFQSGPVGFFIVDANGLLLRLNAAFSRLFDLHPADMTGKHIGSYISVEGDFPYVEGETPINVQTKDGMRLALLGQSREMSGRKLFAFFVHLDGDRYKRIIEAQRSVIKEMNHRLKNNLQIISGLLSIKGQISRSPEVAHFVLETQQRLKAMSLVHENLILGDSEIRLDEYVHELLDSLLRVYPQRGISTEIDMADLKLGGKRAMYVGIVINELVVNALKHAWTFDSKGVKLLKIFAKSIEDDIFEFHIEDNGKGFPEDIDTAKTLGLTMVRILTEQLGGSMEIFSEGAEDKVGAGTKIAIRL